MPENTQTKLQQIALQTIESLQGAGVLQLPKPMVVPSSEEPADLAISTPLEAEEADEPPQTAISSTATEADSLEVLCQQVANCEQCQELASTRTQTVFGVGNPQARLCFLGEAPGPTKIGKGSPLWAKQVSS